MARDPSSIAPSEITPREVFLNRRKLIAAALASGAVAALPEARADAPRTLPPALDSTLNHQYSVSLKPTPYYDVTHYNNFYEFGTSKSDPAEYAHQLRTHPWSLTIGGESEVRGTYHLEDILKSQPLEERIYRFRCVEAWSMVIPWVGFELGAFLKRFKPTSKAKYVKFTTLYAPNEMPGQRYPILTWPYVEGLRMDEAMSPLTLLVVGLYGRVVPKQDGAPLRLIVPWKYGFKSIKSIVKIEFVEHQPGNTWHVADPHEYGFYANVNPHVPHPRWSQATERVIGGGLFARKPTLMFNGYSKEVAYMYKGMNLHKYF